MSISVSIDPSLDILAIVAPVSPSVTARPGENPGDWTLEGISQEDFDSALAAYVAPIALRIWSFVPGATDLFACPFSLDYKIGLDRRLHHVNTYNKGELIKTEYYSEDGGDLILTVDFTYNRDTDGLVLDRTKVISWIFVDGSVCPNTKTMVKKYDPWQSVQEIRRRRANVMDGLRGLSKLHSIQTEVSTLLSDLESEIHRWIEIGDEAVLTSVQNYSGAWLEAPTTYDANITLRQHILNEISL